MRLAVVGDPKCAFVHEVVGFVGEAAARGALTSVAAPLDAGPSEAALITARHFGVPTETPRGRDPLHLAEAADELWTFGDPGEWPLWFQGAGKMVRTKPVGEPALLLFTAAHPSSRQVRGGYRGPSALDVTVRSAPPEGQPFAPSAPLFREAKHRLALAAELEVEDGDATTVAAAELARSEAWAWYAERYHAEMRASMVQHRAAWEAVLARPMVVLICYCPARARCHRGLLASLLARAGAKIGRRVTDAGELTPRPPRT